VCRANIARSYLAQSFLLHALHREGIAQKVVEVVSRGTQVSRLEPVPSDITDIVKRLGVEGVDHVPTQVTESDLKEADLVLVAEKAMEEILVDLSPSSSDRMFSLVEFGRLVSDPSVSAALPVSFGGESEAPDRSLTDRVSVLGHYRGYLAFSEESEDIEDPAGKPREHLFATAQTIEKWSSLIAKWCAEK
jgi:protein-tyrosine-phosphatase